jgi:hypothetical protein
MAEIFGSAQSGRLSAEVLLQMGEMTLGGTEFGFGVAEVTLFFADALDDPGPSEGGSGHASGFREGLEGGDFVGV